jgi:hypothetical protein
VATLLTCLLVFLGSGDDINIARLFFPGGPVEAGGLPLDDPNTDLAESPRESTRRENTPVRGNLISTAPAQAPDMIAACRPLHPDSSLPIPVSTKPFPLRC